MQLNRGRCYNRSLHVILVFEEDFPQREDTHGIPDWKGMATHHQQLKHEPSFIRFFMLFSSIEHHAFVAIELVDTQM